MISQNLKNSIKKAGFTESYIREKIEEVLAIAKTKDIAIGPGISLFICYDMNGPLTSTHDTALHPLPGIRETLSIIKKNNVKKALVSGWDIPTLTAFRDERLKLSDLNIIGEHGAVWEHEGEVHEVSPIPKERVLEMKEALLREAAKENLKIAIQGNMSSRITGIFFEADSSTKGNLSKHILIAGKEISTDAVFHELNKDLKFRFVDGKILFSPNQASIEEFDRVLRTVFPLRSVRLNLIDNDIAFWVDANDRRDYSLKELEAFLEKALPVSWKVMIHDDFGVDIIFKDNSVTKEATSYLAAEKLFDGQVDIITNVGDNPSDVFTKDRSIFFAQRGSGAERHCVESGIPHIAVEHGGDYTLILAALLGL